MKQFLAVYMGSANEENMRKWHAMDADAQKKKEKDGMTAWMNWAEKYSKFILKDGGPLGKTKKINASGISDIKNLMTGFTIVQAESHEDAAKMFLNHPHFTVFPGDSVEIMEWLPIPKM